MTKTKKFTWNGLLNGKKGIMPVAMAAIMTMSGAAAMTNFAASSAIPASAEVYYPHEEDVEIELDKGNVELYKYLKSITPSDKKDLLIQQGESIKFDTSESNHDIKPDGSNLVVTSRSVEKLENNTADIATLEGIVGDLYPGAVVHADNKLVDGTPNMLPIDGVNRRSLPIYLDIAGNTLESQAVKNVSVGTVKPVINQMLEEWFGGSNTTAAANATYKCVMVHSEKQVDMALGVEGAAKKYGVDAKACMKGEKQQMLVIFNQNYYTVRTPHRTVDGLFKDNVTEKDFKDHGVTAENPGLAEVTNMSYGRQIVVKLETTNKSADVETAWRASIGATEIKAEGKYKDIMEDTNYSVCAYGGNSKTVGKLMESRTLSEINKALQDDLQFTAKTPAVPLSYSTTFIDDGTNATVNRATEYVALSRQVRKPITFEVDSASAWLEKSQCLYGRKIVGIKDNGDLILGNWEKICDDKGDVKMDNISGAYAEFGFEVDIRGGTDWPYSNVFWRAENGVVNDIKIVTRGTCRMADISIKVNGKEVFKKKNCDSHSRYNWGI